MSKPTLESAQVQTVLDGWNGVRLRALCRGLNNSTGGTIKDLRARIDASPWDRLVYCVPTFGRTIPNLLEFLQSCDQDLENLIRDQDDKKSRARNLKEAKMIVRSNELAAATMAAQARRDQLGAAQVVASLTHRPHVPAAATTSSSSASRLSAAAAVAAPPPAAAPSPTLNLINTLVEQEEFKTWRGMLEKCHLLGGSYLSKSNPHPNSFASSKLDAEEDVEILKNNSPYTRIMIRFLLFNPGERTVSFPEVWPAQCELRVNDVVVFSTLKKSQFVQTIQPRPLIDVTNIWKTQCEKHSRPPQVTVHLQQTASNTTKKWIVFASGLKFKNKASALETVLGRSEGASVCITRAMNILRDKGEDDESIAVEKVEVSLLDPLTMVAIKDPVRGLKCAHLQCFDFQTFITLQREARIAKWACPVCNDALTLSDLRMDAWFQTIIKEHEQFQIASPPGYRYNKAEVYLSGLFQLIDLNTGTDDEADDEPLPVVMPVASAAVPTSVLRNIGPRHPEKRGRSRDEAIELLDSDDELY